MTDVAESAEPRAHARIAYLGPVSPHWEVYGDWGDRQVLDEFRARVLARLVLLPREDPQFRRNRERIVRDAERQQISIEWDLGIAAAPAPQRAPVAAEEDPATTATDGDAAVSETDAFAADTAAADTAADETATADETNETATAADEPADPEATADASAEDD